MCAAPFRLVNKTTTHFVDMGLFGNESVKTDKQEREETKEAAKKL